MRGDAKCKGCGGAATIHAYDFGDGVASWWCEACRRIVKGGGTAADCRARPRVDSEYERGSKRALALVSKWRLTDRLSPKQVHAKILAVLSVREAFADVPADYWAGMLAKFDELVSP